MKKKSLGSIMIYSILTVWSLTTIIPLLWVLNNSFKPSMDVVKKSFAITLNPIWDNYLNAFSKMSIGKAYLNSFIMSGLTVIFVLAFGSMAAFVLSRYRFRFRALIMTLMVMSLLIPAYATVVPIFEILLKTDLLNTHWALVITHTAGMLPYAVLVISSYMMTIPKDLEEAAFIDGCGRWSIFTKIFAPISRPAFAASSIFIFVWSYNDLFSSLIFVGQEHIRPIVVLLSQVTSRYGTDYGLMSAVVTITIIPILVIYLFIQKYIQQGLTAGAVKG